MIIIIMMIIIIIINNNDMIVDAKHQQETYKKRSESRLLSHNPQGEIPGILKPSSPCRGSCSFETLNRARALGFAGVNARKFTKRHRF